MPSKLTNSFVGLGWFSLLLGIILLGYIWDQQSILLGWIAVVLSFVVSIILFGLVSRLKRKQKQEQIEFLRTFQPHQVDFRKLKSCTSYDLLAKLAINEQQKKIYFWVPDSTKGENITKAFAGMAYTIKTYDFSDLLAVKLIEDGHQITFEKRNSHYTNFFLNKIGEEVMITNPPIDKIKPIDLEVIVNDNTKPRHTIRFYNESYRQIQKNSPEYKAFYKEVQKWFQLLKDILHETEQNVGENNTERSLESIVTEEPFSNFVPAEMTHITMDIDPMKYSLHFTEDLPAPPEEIREDIQDEPKQEQVVKKPTSYFEQLLEKNRRQLRGDYTDD